MSSMKNVAIATLAVALGQIFLSMTQPGQALADKVTDVFVTNTPLAVTGGVNVNNLPAVQNVAGTVNVGNFPPFPASQSVTGSVSVTDQTPLTHVHQPVGQLVTLISAPCTGADCFNMVQVRPDGSEGPSPFVVPAGFDFVMTDVQWTLFSGVASTLVTPMIEMNAPCNVSGCVDYKVSAGVATTDAAGNGGAQVHFTSGVVLGPGGSIFGDLNIPVTGQLYTVVDGYLIPAS